MNEYTPILHEETYADLAQQALHEMEAALNLTT
jgi:hypothetical protein